MENMEFMILEQKRADCYKLLAALFYPPEKQTLMDEDVCGSLFQILDDVSPEASAYASGMRNAIDRTDAKELSIAHAKLFVGPFELQAPPYGSVYLEENKMLMGDSTIDVMKMYQRAGLGLSEENKDAPDHIAIELEFMHYLVSKEVQSMQDGDMNEALEYLKMQHVFFDKYLSPWVEAFCSKIIEASEVEFFRLLATCLSIFINRTPVPGTIPDRAGAST
ncbi:MAG: molecular chaperone TorD family protein [Thermodesulfovibrionales bacterium]|nr:molecular chaperone TorD family protein [Thermodesulfovibrionales bacterium]